MKGDEYMKTRSLFRITVLVAALLLASAAAVAARPSAAGTIECALDISYNGSYWSGTVTGPECSVAGTIRFDAVPEEYSYPGKTMHFVEEFTIEPYGGGVIRGKNWGVWNMSTFKYRAHGWVREASDQWAHLVGSQYHEMGKTSNPADGLPLLAPDGKMKLTPSNRPLHALP
jgi:hypothetical protein